MKNIINTMLLALLAMLITIGPINAQSVKQDRKRRIGPQSTARDRTPPEESPKVDKGRVVETEKSNGRNLGTTPPEPPRRGLTTPGSTRPGAGAPDGLAGNHEFASVYRSEDGGAWYVRKLQNKVFMFGEHPGIRYATVYEGTLSGDTINGKYCDLPKGQRAFRGNLNFRIEDDGGKLVAQSKSGGINLQLLRPYAIKNDQLPSAHKLPGFYSVVPGDLDGAWRSGEDSLYIREVDGKFVGWEERNFPHGQRPTTARSFIGERGANGHIVANFVGLPKALSMTQGSATFIVDDAYHMRQLGGNKWVRDVVNFKKFGDEIVNRFKNKCTGFGYAIAHEGQIVKADGWGQRILASDGLPLPFDADTQKDSQSTAKTITATAVMHLLNAKGMSVDDPIANWLPLSWNKGPGVWQLTFRHLLNHKSGLVEYGDPDEYENLKHTIATGPINMDWNDPTYDYKNCNFAMFRIIIPYIDELAIMRSLEDSGASGVTLNEQCSERYLHYVRKNVLLPAGLSNPQADYTSTNKAYSYNFQQQNVAGYPQQPGQMYEMGAGSWVVSARDYTKFLAALENGIIVSKSTVSNMKSSRFGFLVATTSLGDAFGHGGAIGGDVNNHYGSGRGARAQSMMFPNNVQVYITINSANNQEPAESSYASALTDAFDASLH